jgi:hypothetical protein
LITDNRESVGGIGKKRCIKGVVEHLASMGVECESRPLSVGDYLWLLQWVDWEGQQQELVLDYIVERKTWDDLKVDRFNLVNKMEMIILEKYPRNTLHRAEKPSPKMRHPKCVYGGGRRSKC